MAKTTPVMGVYRILNTVSGLIYVGSSNNVKSRWSKHRSDLRGGRHYLKTLQADWDTHSEAAFEFTLLETVNTLEDIWPCEQKYLDDLNPSDPAIGYNRSPRATGVGWRYTDEQLERLAASMRGKSKTPEHRANIWANRAVTDDHRERMSKVGASTRGVPKTAEHNRKNSEAQRGELNHSCKLTLADCAEIFRRVSTGEFQEYIARDFGVSCATVGLIKNGKHWSSRTTAS